MRFIGLLILGYGVTLTFWLQTNSHYNRFLIETVSIPVAEHYGLAYQEMKTSGGYFGVHCIYTTNITKNAQNYGEIDFPFVIKFLDMNSLVTFSTPISLAILLSFMIIQPALRHFRHVLEVLIIIFFTHFLIVLITTLNQIGYISQEVVAGFFIHDISKESFAPFNQLEMQIAVFAYDYLIGLVIRFEPLLIGIWLAWRAGMFSKNISCKVKSSKTS